MVTLLIDAKNLAYRAKYTFQRSHRGQDVSVIYGFLTVLLSYVERYAPSSVIVCWDGGIPADRMKLVPQYKANRHKNNDPLELEEFQRQQDALVRIIPSIGMINVLQKGMEADDLLFHASRILEGECIIVSTDGDMLQAITPDGRVQVFNPLVDKMINWSNFQENIGVQPEQYVDYKTLMGDKSDNISGVPGIGEAFAKELLEKYGGLDRAWRVISLRNDSDASRWSEKLLQRANYDEIMDMRRAMDLSRDRYGSIGMVKKRSGLWMRHNHMVLKNFLNVHGLHEMTIGGIKPKLDKLVAPVFIADDVIRVTITKEKI